MLFAKKQIQSKNMADYNYGAMLDALIKDGVAVDYRVTDHAFRDDARNVQSFNGTKFKNEISMAGLGCGNKGEYADLEVAIIRNYTSRHGEPLFIKTGTSLPHAGAYVPDVIM